MSGVMREDDHRLAGGFEPCPDCRTATWCAHLKLCLSMTTPYDGAGYGALRDATPPAPTETPAPDLEALVELEAMKKANEFIENCKNSPTDYQLALIGLGMVARSYLDALRRGGPEGVK